MTDYQPGTWIGGGGNPGYLGCAHSSCSKKVRTTALGHDCCGHSKHSHEHDLATQPDAEPLVTVGDVMAEVGQVLRARFGRRR